MASKPNKSNFQNAISTIVQLPTRILKAQKNKQLSPRKKMAKK
jgi:hypothetical protein